MKKLLFFTLFSITSVFAQDSLDSIREEIKAKYGLDSFVTRAFLKNLDQQLELYKNIEDKEKYVSSYRKYGQGRQCLIFLLNENDLPQFRELVMRIEKLPDLKDLHKKDFKMLMNREVRTQVKDVYATPIEEAHQFCEDKLPADLVAKMISEKKAAKKNNEEEQKRYEQDYKLSTYEEVHPEIRKILLNLQNEMSLKSKDLTPLQVDQKVQMTYVRYIASIINTKAQLKVIPEMEKKCPGKTEALWKNCVGKKYYDNPLQQKMTPGLVRLLCLNDHKASIVPNCIDEKQLLVGRDTRP